jgi:hypothetical protein
MTGINAYILQETATITDGEWLERCPRRCSCVEWCLEEERCPYIEEEEEEDNTLAD